MRPGLRSFSFAEHAGDTLGALLLVTYGERATFLYGGITNTKRNLMGGYALQWAALQIAKQEQCSIYDFYGFDAFRSSEHPYARFSQFKSQFGGMPMRFIGAHDYVFLDNLADSMIKVVNEGSRQKHFGSVS
jgi:lipid II:glycine glycyltransferase (peptidoglycan interpeptide bridge formation enzyme)